MKSIPETEYLGDVCSQGHQWQSTGFCCRYRSDDRCVTCHLDYIQEKKRVQEQQEQAAALFEQEQKELLALAMKSIPETEYLGDVCSAGYQWQSTGFCRRYRSDDSCVICRLSDIQEKKREQKKRHQERQEQATSMHLELNLNTQYLGKLCLYNHQFRATETSRRYKSNDRCVVCHRLGEREREKRLGKKRSKGDVAAQGRRRLQRQHQKKSNFCLSENANMVQNHFLDISPR